MKIAFTADGQIDSRSRMEEFVRVHDFMAEDAQRRGCTAFLHGGDVYERRSTSEERAAVRSWLSKVTRYADVAIVGGNHEAPGEVDELTFMGDQDRRSVVTTERPLMFIERKSGVAVAMLPWPRRSSLAAWVGKPLGREELNAVGLDALRSILRGFAQEWKDWKGPKILLAHAMVRGSRQGPDQPIMPGQDFELGLEDLALAEAHVNLLGHIHMPQEWDVEPFPCNHPPEECSCDPKSTPTIYAGSPRRTAYASGELEPKGYVVLEFDGPRLVKWERVPTPATPLYLVEAAFQPGVGFVWAGSGVNQDFTGAEVRFRYEVDADNRDEAKRYEAGLPTTFGFASEIKIEPIVRPRSTARLAAVSGDKPLAEKIALVWDRDGVSAERRPSLLARLAELEGGGA